MFVMKILLTKIVFFIVLGWIAINPVYAESPQIIKISYLTQQQKPPAALSNLDVFIQHKGLMGAKIAVDDNNTTGQFTAQKFELKTIIVPVEGDVIEQFQQQVSDDTALVITNLPAQQLKQIADLDVAKGKLFFDATTTDDDLRNNKCRNNILHMLPSRAMRADALAQYMMKKRWTKWFLVSGMTAEDRLYASAIKRAVGRFGIKLVAE